MKKFFTFIISITFLFTQHDLLLQSSQLDRSIKSPSEFLGYEIGDYYTQHHDVMAYMLYLNQVASSKSAFFQYGKTNQHRELNLVVISSAANISNIETIKSDNILLSKGLKPKNEVKPIIWLAYNVHGNETSSSEASMVTAYHLLAGTDAQTQSYLDESVIIIDPMMNPDGRERYISWFKNTVGQKANPDINAIEHNEIWPGGRSNHYMFDLNRDWVFASQVETQQRLLVYHQFKPHVFVDFHEMGYNSAYFFFPATRPINPLLPSSTKKWGEHFGEGNGKMFDQFGSLYYTAESFDLFYPGYGDSYPSFNGSIGMTYEQSGHSRSGKNVQRNDGSFLTLRERAYNHYKMSIATINTAVTKKSELITDFGNFFKTAKRQGSSDKADYYVIGQNGNYKELIRMLSFHDLSIQYSTEEKRISVIGGQSVTIKKGQAVIPVNQSQYIMLRALFDDQISIPDTAFYDLSSWSVPRAFNVDVFRTSTSIRTQNERPNGNQVNIEPATVAYAFTPTSIQSYQFFAAIQKQNIRSRLIKSKISIENTELNPGSIMISVKRNSHIANLHDIIQNTANQFGVDIKSFNMGMASNGVDLGSSTIAPIQNNSILIFTGEDLSSLNVGALWHLFDQKLEIDVTMMNLSTFSRANIDHYTTIIIPDDWANGRRIKSALGDNGIEKLKQWIQDGGHAIGVKGGAHFLTDNTSKITSAKTKTREQNENGNDVLITMPYKNRSDYFSKQSFPGAFFKIRVDKSHPLTVGLSSPFYVLKTSRSALETHSSYYNVGLFQSSSNTLGYAHQSDKDHIDGTPVILHKSQGNGNVTLMNIDPVYRSFTYGATQLFLNCVFIGNARI
jgi:hypothetical protein